MLLNDSLVDFGGHRVLRIKVDVPFSHTEASHLPKTDYRQNFGCTYRTTSSTLDLVSCVASSGQRGTFLSHLYIRFCALSPESQQKAFGMEGSVLKVLDSDYSGDLAGMFPEILAVPEGDDSMPGFQFKEEMVEEVMQELWKEISSPPPRLPSPDVPGFALGTSRESCGASFSDSASTVMAGVEMGGGGSGVVGASLVGLAGRRAGRAAAGKGSATEVAKEECYVPEFVAIGGEGMDGCDGLAFDDEWLSRVLSWGPLDLDDWT